MTEIPVCPQERFSSYNTLFRLVPCYKRDWATLLHRCYYLLLVTFHLLQSSWKINEKDIKIENTTPFGVSFIKCLIDHRPLMPCCHCKLHPSCKTHQTQM
ncbi:hypothetical protein ZWY2020_005831 [Hordeum vulgare]|nr:hypothetical protein ZWY2020_005831 [Hordeum vulgare]